MCKMHIWLRFIPLSSTASACGSRFYVDAPSYSALVMRNWRSANGLTNAKSGGEAKTDTGPIPPLVLLCRRATPPTSTEQH